MKFEMDAAKEDERIRIEEEEAAAAE